MKGLIINNIQLQRKSYQQFADSKKTSIFALPNSQRKK